MLSTSAQFYPHLINEKIFIKPYVINQAAYSYSSTSGKDKKCG